MNRAFSLIELIFVIVIIGILAGVGFSYIKPNFLQRDGEFVLLKVKQARYNAIGNYDNNNTNICIKLKKNDMDSKEIDEKSQNPYKLHATIDITNPPSFNSQNKLCFDSLGRPHNGDSYTSLGITDLSNLLAVSTDIKLTYKSKNCTIRVYPSSGYGIILCKN